jgi:hypothetical protein
VGGTRYFSLGVGACQDAEGLPYSGPGGLPAWIVGGASKSCGESCEAIGKTWDSSVQTVTTSRLKERVKEAGEDNPSIGSFKTGSGLNPAYL